MFGKPESELGMGSLGGRGSIPMEEMATSGCMDASRDCLFEQGTILSYLTGGEGLAFWVRQLRKRCWKAGQRLGTNIWAGAAVLPWDGWGSTHK